MATTERAPRVLLGVTGGIAAYKAPELVRRLVERGCEVQVVMSRGAREFVGPLTFQAVSGRRVRDDLWDQAAEAAMGHIELARWADIVIVAPATAHFLGTLAAYRGTKGRSLSVLMLVTLLLTLAAATHAGDLHAPAVALTAMAMGANRYLAGPVMNATGTKSRLGKTFCRYS